MTRRYRAPSDTERRALVELATCKGTSGIPYQVFGRRLCRSLIERGWAVSFPMRTIEGGWFGWGDYVVIVTDAGREVSAHGQSENTR